jgi:predicted TPR repeat methyltransferase
MQSRATALGNVAAQKQAAELYQQAMTEYHEETANILGRMGAAAANFDKKKAAEMYKRTLDIQENQNKEAHRRALAALTGK